MPNVMVNSEMLPVDVGERVFWVNLQTRRINTGSETTGVVQYWAYLPPGMRPATIRGKDREAVIAEVQQAIASQALGS